MIAKSDSEIAGLKEVGGIIRNILDTIETHIRVGVSTLELDQLVGEMLAQNGARSAPKLAYDFPGYSCISLNDEAAHGIPSNRKLKKGELVNVDVSAEKNGFWADSGRSFAVEGASDDDRFLLSATRQALAAGIEQARAGNPISYIARAVEEVATCAGFNIIDGLVGHGVGRHIHEPPEVHNTFNSAGDEILQEGLVITIEPS